MKLYARTKKIFGQLIYICMNNIRDFRQFEPFSLKTIGGKEVIFCKGCQHTFEAPKPQPKKLICPACAAMGLLNRGLAYLKPIERKF